MFRKLGSLRCQVLEPLRSHRSTLIWLHGLGDTSEGFAELMRAVVQPALPHLRVVLPNAPIRPITVNGGALMPGWYDLAAIGGGRLGVAEDADGIEASAASLGELLDGETEQLGGDSRRLVVGGFSQGGAMALRMALAWPEPLAAAISASAYVVRGEALVNGELEANANRQLPVLTVHGELDDVVPLDFSRATFAPLEAANIGAFVHERVAHCAHEFPLSTARRVARFLDEQLADANATEMPPTKAAL